jgi:ribosomal peptide maturation radical SAM protein 1
MIEKGHKADVFYYNLRLAEVITNQLYCAISENSNGRFIGDWLFATAAFGARHDEASWYERLDFFRKYGLQLEDLTTLRNDVLPGLLDRWVAEVDWTVYSGVGFTVTFEQCVASFAMARRIKEKHSHIAAIFGGSYFNVDNSVEFVRKLPWIDYIVLGDGDRSLPLLADRIAHHKLGDGIPGLVLRLQGEVKATSAEMFHDLDNLPDPDYDEYFTTLESVDRDRVLGSRKPKIVFNSTRGCWWGQKHHCKFCGLNDNRMLYRSRKPLVVYEELKRQAARYGTLLFSTSDNILEMRYIDTLFAWLRDSGYEFRLGYEVKANLTRAQILKLVEGGMSSVQAGIESLNTQVLRSMNKGTTMLLNVRMLKWAKYYGLPVSWNILVGFPGETEETYLSQMRLIPLIRHLEPPTHVSAIGIFKYSPYGYDYESYWDEPNPIFAMVYPPSLFDITKIAYFCVNKWISPVPVKDVLLPLREAVRAWRRAWSGNEPPSMVFHRGPDWIRIDDYRDASEKVHWLDKFDAELYEYCSDTARSVSTATSHLNAARSKPCCEVEVKEALQAMTEDGLMVAEDGLFMSLAIPERQGEPRVVDVQALLDAVSWRPAGLLRSTR